MSVSQADWTQPGATLSHKNACKEFGIEESEIIEAIRRGRLQYKENYAHGNLMAIHIFGCLEMKLRNLQKKYLERKLWSCKELNIN